VALTFSTQVKNARADALTAAIDSGSGAGKLRIYTGSKPASPNDAATGTLLVEFTLNDPSFGAAASGVITLDVSPAVSDSSANATGTAGYARFVDSDNDGHIDATVTATGGGGDVTLNTVSIVEAAVVTVTSGTITEAG
jgi:hypothetical protein